MAKILHLEEWRGRRAREAGRRAKNDAARPRAEATTAQVLLFTGVRYEYLETTRGTRAQVAGRRRES